jgi:predicted TIM-barrel fold metal-dependent hydrolase
VQVLIVHLLRFKYEGSQSHKISAPVHFDSDLHLPAKMFAEGAPSKHACYALFAIINHMGKPSMQLDDHLHACCNAMP